MSTDDVSGQMPDRASVSVRVALAANWWALALRGVFGIVFGLIALILPGATILSLILVFAAYVLLDGLLAVTAAVRAVSRHERWGYLLLEGVVNIAVAIVAVAWPGITVVTFVYLLAVWALVTGALMFGAAFRLDAQDGRWWLLLGGVVSFVYGAALVVAPFAGAVVLTWWLGAYALVFGIAVLIAAIRLRSVA